MSLLQVLVEGELRRHVRGYWLNTFDKVTQRQRLVDGEVALDALEVPIDDHMRELIHH